MVPDCASPALVPKQNGSCLSQPGSQTISVVFVVQKLMFKALMSVILSCLLSLLHVIVQVIKCAGVIEIKIRYIRFFYI